MNSRERVLAALNHEEADRVAIHDYPWLSAIMRWHKEGLPVDLSPFEYFDYEIVRIAPDTTPRFPESIVEETEDYIIHTNRVGQLLRDHKDFSTTPEIIETACKNREDWEALKRDWGRNRRAAALHGRHTQTYGGHGHPRSARGSQCPSHHLPA